jgi:hypothetical protein
MFKPSPDEICSRLGVGFRKLCILFQFSFFKKHYSPQSRRERKEEKLSIAGEGSAIDRLRHPSGNDLAGGQGDFVQSRLPRD